MEKYRLNFKNFISKEKEIKEIDYLKKQIEELTSSCELKLNNSFFRYRAINEHTLSEIINQHVFMASLDSFDDIFEGKYLINDQDVKNGVDSFEVDEFNDYCDEHIKMACFTTDNKNIPMWYYYADKHRGVCLEYKYRGINITDVNMFLPVTYVNKSEYSDYSFVPKNRNQFKTGAFINSLLKSKDWEFEKEWRAISFIPDECKTKPLYIENMYIDTIYFGREVSMSSIEVIKNIVDKNKLDIKLYKMVKCDTGLVGFPLKDVVENSKYNNTLLNL